MANKKKSSVATAQESKKKSVVVPAVKSKTAASAVTTTTTPATQMEKSLVRALKKQNAGITKAPKTLGSTRGSEIKKLKDLNKKKLAAKKKAAAKKNNAKPPGAGNLPFLTYQNAVDLALFYCPGKYLTVKEVREFVNKNWTSAQTGHDNLEASQKKLLERLGKVLARGVEEQEESSVRYNAIVAPADDGSPLRLIYKYKLDPKHRARVTAGVNFQPVFPEDFDASMVKEIQSKKAFVVPAYRKRPSKPKSSSKTSSGEKQTSIKTE